MGYSTEREQAGREILPDLIRSFAILGIVLVNVAYFAWPGEVTYHNGGLDSSTDYAAYWLVNSLFAFKSYSLFSLMFGVGLAYQMISAERRGDTFEPRYFRRIFGLIVLGALHFVFFFYGDILLIYAFMGSLLYFYRHAQVKTLTIWGLILIAVMPLMMGVFALMFWALAQYAPEEMAEEQARLAETVAKATEVFQNGSFWEAAQYRASQWPFWILGLVMQGTAALGYFCLGLAAVRTGMIASASHPRWKSFRRKLLIPGLIGSALGGYVIVTADSAMSAQGFLGMFIITVFAPLSTAGYAGLIAKWAEGPMQGLKKVMARGGTATLSAYLLQSVILSFMFSAYGLDLFGQLSASTCIVIALGTGLFSLGFVSLWRTQFARGPVEIPFRYWTYLGKR